MEKPIKPIEPKFSDFAKLESDGTNIFGNLDVIETPFVLAYRKYQKDIKKYEKDLGLYEQLKFIKFIKAANETLILKKYRITKI